MPKPHREQSKYTVKFVCLDDYHNELGATNMDASSYEEFQRISAEMDAIRNRVRKVVKAGNRADHAELRELTEICEDHLQRLEDLERRLERGSSEVVP